ncbi:MAG: MarR family winged helix-turn-helix transcriptional regulator [Phycisphaerae bacterium]
MDNHKQIDSNTMDKYKQAGSNRATDYQVRILRSLRKIIRAVDIHSRRLHKEYNITTPQLICLHSLMDGKPKTLSELAEDISLGMSTTTGIVDRLVARKMVNRVQSSHDRRKIALTITETGKEVARTAPTLLQEQFSEAFEELSELEQATLTLSLEQTVSMMGACELDSSPNLMSGERVKINEINSEEL